MSMIDAIIYRNGNGDLYIEISVGIPINEDPNVGIFFYEDGDGGRSPSIVASRIGIMSPPRNGGNFSLMRKMGIKMWETLKVWGKK